ncbi:MAG: enoyl-CoA hydratase/isomerase family protein [Acidimicrobiia bacterium]|nr:enoyl-CoA hydratase/isomerase family protein [Acidimicrobiia bacterium]
MERLVLLDRSEMGSVITLNRPHRANSLIPELLSQLKTALLTAADDGAPIVLTANGAAFSTGGDIGAFWQHRADLAAYAETVVGQLNDVILTMLGLPVPIVTPVHGPVTGGSFGLILASDIVLVAPEASFRPWYGVIGFSPDGGWTALLPDVIGRQRAAEILLTDDTITAEQSVDWGLATELVPAGDLLVVAARFASLTSAQYFETVRSAKVLLAGYLTVVAARLEAERRQFVHQVVTAAAAEGMARFVGAD